MTEYTERGQSRFFLQYKAAYLESLDESAKPISGADGTGFIRKESDRYFLYTCWHVVTGFQSPHELGVPIAPPIRRRFLRVTLQDQRQLDSETTSVGGVQSWVLPLYSGSQPLWFQDKVDTPHSDINAIDILVPAKHDAVKIALPLDANVPWVQVVDHPVYKKSIMPGDKLYIVGFPYGFSALGSSHPTAVVLTRFVAANQVQNRPRDFLLESAGAPVMSGSPVFLDSGQDVYLLGIYTGLIHPGHRRNERELATALGCCCNMTVCWERGEPLVAREVAALS